MRLVRIVKSTAVATCLFTTLSMSADITTGLVAHYPLDGNAQDLSANSRDGLLVNIRASEDRNLETDGAIDLNGINGYVDLPNVAKPRFPLTIAAWINLDNLTRTRQLFRNDSANDSGARWGLDVAILSDGRPLLTYYNGFSSPENKQSAIANTAVRPQLWQHLAIVINGHLDFQFYINGIPRTHSIDPTGTGTNVSYSSAAGAIGWRNSVTAPSWFAGLVDDLRVYERALTEADIRELGTGRPVSRDMNGDRTSDVLLRSESTDIWELHLMSDGISQESLPTLEAYTSDDWVFLASDDLDGDGDADILMRNSTTGIWHAVWMQAGIVLGSDTLSLPPESRWRFQALVDSDGDEVSEVLYRNSQTGAWRIATLNDRAVSEILNLSVFRNQDWILAGIGDADQDGDDDIVVRHATTGGWRLFEIDQSEVASVSSLAVWKSPLWQTQSLIDLDGDTDFDVLVRNTSTGSYRAFEIDNGAVTSVVNPGLLQGAEWTLENLGDYDQDMDFDILLRQASGAFRLFILEQRASVGGVNPRLNNDPDMRVQ